jgi:putative ABC transport system substrate-binding protein
MASRERSADGQRQASFELIVEDDERAGHVSRVTRRRLLAGVSIAMSAAGVGLAARSLLLSPELLGHSTRIYRVVFLFTRLTEAAPQASIANFKKTMLDLGYIDGQNIEYGARDAAGDATRFPSLAVDVVALRPDAIVCQNPQAAQALMRVTQTIPIVIVSTQSDVVEAGLVKDLARPGGNLTGLTAGGPGIASKRLQLLKETAPHIGRVAVLQDQGEPGRDLVEMQKAASGLGVELIPIYLRSLGDVDTALVRAVEARSDALIQSATTGFITGTTNGSEIIAAFALERRWPTMGVAVAAGGLLGYNTVLLDAFKRAAERYVHRIFKGAAPGDLPFELGTGSLFALNMCTATKIGLTVPQSILTQVTEVVPCRP